MTAGRDLRAGTPPDPRLTPAESDRLRALVREYCGIRIDDYKLEHALAVAWPTLRLHGVADVADLIRDLTAWGRRLWPVVVPFLTINETYFMREARQLEDFVRVAVPELRHRASARGEGTLQVLSAACSSGEEVYTLAVLLRAARAQAQLTGVDIDPVVLARADAGEYGPNSFRAVDAGWRDATCEPVGRERWRVRDACRTGVSFACANLLQAEAQLVGRRFDAIFCRNVLIYFDRPTQLEVIHQLRRLLVPGGYLCLGHSEMFFGVDLGLEVVVGEGSTLYRRGESTGGGLDEYRRA